MLEAARLASCAVNAQWQRAVVGFRDDLTGDPLNRLRDAGRKPQRQMAPVRIHWFNDLGIVNKIKGSRLRELVDVGALAPTPAPQVRRGSSTRRSSSPSRRTPVTDPVDHGCRHRHVPSAAHGVDEGLGVGLVTLNGDVLQEVFHTPDDWIPLSTILVGYPSESWDGGGGQRPRPPFEEPTSRASSASPSSATRRSSRSSRPRR